MTFHGCEFVDYLCLCMRIACLFAVALGKIGWLRSVRGLFVVCLTFGVNSLVACLLLCRLVSCC